MTKKESRKKRIKKKLTYKYRLVVANEDTFEEHFEMRLSRLNVFVICGLFSFLLIGLTVLLVMFTPLKEYIPGYASTKLKKKVIHVSELTDSLKNQVSMLKNYTESVKAVLNEEIKPEAVDSLQKEDIKNVNIKALNPTAKVLKFREKINSQDRFPLTTITEERTKNVFLPPVTGKVSQQFNEENKHFAIDVVAKKGTPVKSIANGTVILSEWTAETGYVLTIQHVNNFISVYKHNGTLLKKQGDQVKLGEVIAEIGSTGELTTGPHLHFELWNKGFPVNPIDYIDFQ